MTLKHNWYKKSRIRQTMLKAKFYAHAANVVKVTIRDAYDEALTEYFLTGMFE